MRASGTVAVGDISNTLVTVPLLREARTCRRMVFHELLGFQRRRRTPRGGRARAGAARRRCGRRRARRALAPHAPYLGVAELFSAIRADVDAHRRSPLTSVHLGESAEEVEFLRDGTGPWRDAARGARRVARRLGAAGRVAGRRTSCDLGFLDRASARRARRAVRRRRPGAARRARRDARVLPAQQRVGRRRRSAARARSTRSGVHVAVGTDSLASVRRPEPVRRAGRAAPARAGVRRRGGCSRAPRSAARARSARATTSAPSSRASARR